MLETKRLIIRHGKSEDVQAIKEFRNSEFVLKFNAMTHSNEEMILKEISNSYVLYEKNLHKAIGVISIEEDSLRYDVKGRCISYYLNEFYTKQGYMREALEAVIQDLFNQGYEIISARVFVGNDASKRLLEKLGFIHEGTLRHAVKGYKGIIYDDQLFSLKKENKQ